MPGTDLIQPAHTLTCAPETTAERALAENMPLQLHGSRPDLTWVQDTHQPNS
ncbi:hypothetical protein [Arthrobacter sp. AET 35A]|uniref:hypothetical protein n=1 Tax=Arthrobacter sp. AET 35A TaxID=2292643 RepID=UPI00177B9353|nr:hypothetical protein [Arthrobacter sp. AET 35A]